MKLLSGAVYDEIRKNHVNSVTPVLTAEWNFNRYYKAIAANTPSEDTDGYDIEMFPIESIVMPDRPRAGINKAVVGQALVANDYHSTVPSARYYTASVDDQYKYWQSPLPSAATTPFNITNCQPEVRYFEEDGTTPKVLTVNKIFFTIENTYAKPDAFNVQVQTSPGGAWLNIVTNPVIPADGRVELWYTGSAWSTTKTLGFTANNLYGVRLNVTSMDKYAYFNLIELGSGLELDLSADLISVDDTFNMGESDFITPMGTISSNTGSVSLMNETRKYSNDNPASTLYGLMDKNVEFNLAYSYSGTLVQQFSLFSDDWTENEDSTDVSLVDNSKFFMDMKPNPCLYRDIPVQEAIWRLCDAVGFTNYAVNTVDTAANSIINIFWADGEQTLWEIFSELSRGTQTAIYFDAYGTLRIKTREAAFPVGATPVWTLREIESGTELPDIVDLTQNDQYEANKVTVNYRPTGFSEMVGNIIPFEVVWEPEGSVVVRSSDLTGNLLVGGTIIQLNAKDAKVWPWVGMCQIEGEWIAYEGKKYGWYNTSNVRQISTVKSLAEQKEIDAKSSPTKKHLNGYNGNLVVKERGLFNTEELDHYADASGWTRRRVSAYNTPGTEPAKGFRHNKTSSTVTLENNKNQKTNDYFYVHRGNAVDQGWRRLGTRMKIDNTGHKDKMAGIFFGGDALGAGYFVEIMPTARMNGKMRQTRNEILFYSMQADGSKKAFGGERLVSRDKSKNHSKGSKKITNIGAEAAIVQNRYFELDIHWNPGTSDQIRVYVNGRLAIDTTVPAGAWKHSFVSRWGMFVRGHSQATFDYMYGISRSDILYDDEEIFQDRIDGGYFGKQYIKDYIYNTRMVRRKVRRKWTKVAQKYKQRYYEEFGPMVHEIREFDVKFNTEGLPVLESKLFHSNGDQAVCPEYVHDVSGAKFLIANTSREHAVVNGEDTLSALGEGSIDQKLFIYGRPVIMKDEETIEKTDDWAIRRRGVIETEFSSKWVQNKEAAEALATWMTTNWTRSDSALTVEVFGNPLFELGDVVAVQHEEMTAATHKFYVTGISTAYDAGITTSLTLRRVSN